MKIAYQIVFLFQAVCLGSGLKILIVFPFSGKSHFILGNVLGRGLAEAGHEVTVMSPYEDKTPTKNGKYTNIMLEGMNEEATEKNNGYINKFNLGDMNPFIFIPFMNFMGNVYTNNTFTNANFKKLIDSDQKFDVVVIEQFKNDALRVLACHYKAPLVLISSIEANSWVNSLVGNPSPPSYIPDVSLSYTKNMNIWQRAVNLAMYLAQKLADTFFFLPAQNEIARKYFPTCVDEYGPISNVSLVLLNSHESIHDPIPFVPNMVNIGGYHIKPPKSLPKDLQEYIDSAKDGVVYFSLGTNLKPSEMSQDCKRDILTALGKLKQRVLWKWDEDNLPGKPENVRIGKWFPQQEILAHPNVKLFITHGGLLSAIETIYHGVPILALPVFGDQKMNAAKAVAGGYALSLSISQLSEETLSEALNDLLNNPKYRENAKRRSALMHDRKVKPMDLAIYWIEYVARHKGAPHLRVAALDLTWYQYFLLDIILIVTAIGGGLLLASFWIFRKLCCSKKAAKKLKKN